MCVCIHVRMGAWSCRAVQVDSRATHTLLTLGLDASAANGRTFRHCFRTMLPAWCAPGDGEPSISQPVISQ